MCISAGNSADGRLSRSATRRARRPSASTIWARTIRCSALIWTSSSVASTWPSRTWSPWRTASVLTMPPSRCCTSLRFWSTLTVPAATTAPSSIAQAAQPPHPATSSTVSTRPARMRGHRRNGRSRGTSRAGTGRRELGCIDMLHGFSPPQEWIAANCRWWWPASSIVMTSSASVPWATSIAVYLAVVEFLEAEAHGPAVAAAVLLEVDLLEQVGDLFLGVVAVPDGDLVGGGHDPVADREVGDLASPRPGRIRRRSRRRRHWNSKRVVAGAAGQDHRSVAGTDHVVAGARDDLLEALDQVLADLDSRRRCRCAGRW